MAALDAPMPGGMPPMDPSMMGGMPPPEAQAPGGDVEGAFATIESSLEGAPPEKAEEARVHINALREILGTEAAPPPEEEPPAGPDEGIPPTPEVP